MPTLKEEGKIEVNKQYQEAIKIAINLITASLVLPIVFLKNILGVSESQIKGNLSPLAYVCWFLLGASLLACIMFYYYSTKYTKAVYHLYEDKPSPPTEKQIETSRGIWFAVAAPTAILGLVFLLLFFLKELS
jgi:tellurite resistance protein TehA-like permease